MRRLLCLLLLACALACQAATLELADNVQRYDLASYVDVLEDRSGKMSFDDVTKPDAPFKAAEERRDLNFGYRDSVYWLRLTVLPPLGGSRQSWLFEVAYPTLDSVTLYQPAQGAYWSDETGDLLPFASRPVEHRNFVFPMRLDGQGPQTVYLRVHSQGNVTIPFSLWQADAFNRNSQTDYAGQALFFGGFLALTLYNLVLYLILREKLLLFFVLFAASLAFGYGAECGLGYQFVWGDMPRFANAMYPVGMALAGLCGVIFTRRFLNTAATLPSSDALLQGLAVLFAAVVPLVFVRYQAAAVLVSILALVFCLAALAMGIRAAFRRYYGAVFYLLAWGFLLVFAVIGILRNMAVVPNIFFTLHSMQIGAAAEMLLLSFALADRYRRVYQERELAREDALKTKQQMVDALRTHERMLELRVAERTAELQRINHKLQDSEERLRDMAHHDSLTGLANRVLFDIRLEHALKTAARHDASVAVMLLDMDDFKPVNDRYGHAVGDELLVQLARRMESAVRQTDTVARLGGDEFIILLESISGPDAVLPIVDKLIHLIQAPVQTQVGVAVQVGVSIGYTVSRPGEMDRNALINRADQSMYEAKKAGGNRACLGTA